MTVMAAETPLPVQEDDLLEEAFRALETPEGLQAELIEGDVVVTPPPSGDHEKHISRLVKLVLKHSSTAMDFSGHKGLLLPRAGGCPRNYVIPDATFVPEELDAFAAAPPWMAPDDVTMVAEVTSSHPETDRLVKRRCYAQAAIPLYLLLDREQSLATLYSQPKAADYKGVIAVSYGRPLPLPEPFGFELDTGEFL
ncbi:Uma2 family endonuclease [Streptomyces sp. DSM 44917]|uniref:Uma2 family endonuclease n=1 Tax=Streptomyces boetiae TaxID=3075541 RepID=A0ABU2LDU0_9ACTN|nr:Uma2 family endonuclease [Streptomyces sp. DSM 44917]MDT0309749.1 Uma2 family endonuclease [Streptomyces sp. DSM 44917]